MYLQPEVKYDPVHEMIIKPVRCLSGIIHLSAQTLLSCADIAIQMRRRHLPIMPWNRFVAMKASSSSPPVPCTGIDPDSLNRYHRADPVRAGPLTWDSGMQRRQATPAEDRDAPRQAADSSMAAAAEGGETGSTPPPFPSLRVSSAAVRDDSGPPSLSLSLSVFV